jgi:hypothetical protein
MQLERISLRTAMIHVNLTSWRVPLSYGPGTMNCCHSALCVREMGGVCSFLSCMSIFIYLVQPSVLDLQVRTVRLQAIRIP